VRRAKAHRLFSLKKHTFLMADRTVGSGEGIEYAVEIQEKNRRRSIHDATL
jgi:hypothetical protein